MNLQVARSITSDATLRQSVLTPKVGRLPGDLQTILAAIDVGGKGLHTNTVRVWGSGLWVVVYARAVGFQNFPMLLGFLLGCPPISGCTTYVQDRERRRRSKTAGPAIVGPNNDGERERDR